MGETILKVTVSINGLPIEMTIEQARALWAGLGEIFEPKKEIAFRYVPYYPPYPSTPPLPSPWVWKVPYYWSWSQSALVNTLTDNSDLPQSEEE